MISISLRLSFDYSHVVKIPVGIVSRVATRPLYLQTHIFCKGSVRMLKDVETKFNYVFALWSRDIWKQLNKTLG